ncbi:MAG TPA: hypothetical protein VMB72_00960 [Acidimicrobiales bacterium]|nr:hypothetical protein [Acidimicrobiales bacterium]
MFEHLDDPAPPPPTPGTLAAVLARAATLRRRRVGAALGTVGVAALGLGIVIGVVASGPGRAPVYAAFDSQTGLIARGTAVPPSDLDAVVFIGATRGFGLALHDGRCVLVTSGDGGSTWTVVDPSLPVGFPAQFEFADATHGYLWGGPPSPSGTVPLWVTADGGRSWTQAAIGPVVSDVSAIGPDVWAVVGACPVSATAAPSCPVVVEVSHDDGSGWASTGTAPPLSESPAVSVDDQRIELARITETRAYVLSFAPGPGPLPGAGAGPAGVGLLAYTADGGRTWTARPDPCPRFFDVGEQLAASGTDDLWMICGSQASEGIQAKALYRSGDGGQHWVLTAGANAAVLAGGTTVAAAGGLPLGGYVAPYSLGHENLAVLSVSSAWLFPDRSGVVETTDGGRTWQPVPGLSRTGFVGQGSGNVVFADATHGWVCDAGTGLWRTTDGVTWTRLGP